MNVLGILFFSSTPTAATAEPYLRTSLANTPDDVIYRKMRGATPFFLLPLRCGGATYSNKRHS